MSDPFRFKNVEITPSMATEYILELYGNRLEPIRSSEMYEDVEARHREYGGIPNPRGIESVVLDALNMLRRNEKVELVNRGQGIWRFFPDAVDAPTITEEQSNEDKQQASGVYGYFYPESKELATLKKRDRWLIKVGRSEHIASRVQTQTASQHQTPVSFSRATNEYRKNNGRALYMRS